MVQTDFYLRRFPFRKLIKKEGVSENGFGNFLHNVDNEPKIQMYSGYVALGPLYLSVRLDSKIGWISYSSEE